jgi:hypothetical protein
LRKQNNQETKRTSRNREVRFVFVLYTRRRIMTNDSQDTFAMHRDGLYIGQPMTGDGTFGKWSLARMVQNASCSEPSLELHFERLMTPEEISVMLNQPYNFWLLLVSPPKKQSGRSWALLQCRPSEHSQALQVKYSVDDPDDLSNKVAV